jgi:small subunit ribosomal protein S20
VAIEKNAVERAIRPGWRSGAGMSGALGVSKLGYLSFNRYSRRPPRAGKAPVRALDMANIASQKKRILRSERERTENRLLTSTVKTHFRRLESAAEAGDAGAIENEQRDLVAKIDKAVQKGALHKNTGARKKSKAARIAAAAAK